METKTKWIIGGVSVAAIVAAVIVIIKKKKKKAASTDTSDYNDTNTKTTINTGIVYNGITQAQTKKLQQKLNAFISSGKLGWLLGWLGATTYSFKTENGKDYYKGSNSSKWYQITSKSNVSSALSKAYGLWKAGQVSNKAASLVPTTKTNTTKSTTLTKNDIVNNIRKATNSSTGTANPSAALTTFKNSISANIAKETGTGLREDGKYGDNTLAVVKALQVYLNAVKGSNLVVDGKYGTNTDIATGWGIC